jgi:hypothetical protein
LDYALDKESPSYEITLSEDGQEAYLEYDRKVELNLRPDGRYAHMLDWGAKLVGQMLRIAGIIAVCEGRVDIDSDIIERAATLADWYAANAETLFSKTTSKSKEDETPAEYLLRRLKKWTPGKAMTVKNVRDSTQHKTNFNFADTLDELESQGIIRIERRGKSEIIVLV